MSKILLSSAALVLLAACGDAAQPRAGGSAAAPDNGDWPQWGHTSSKNMVSDAKDLPFTFNPGKLQPDGNVDMATTKNVLWVA